MNPSNFAYALFVFWFEKCILVNENKYFSFAWRERIIFLFRILNILKSRLFKKIEVSFSKFQFLFFFVSDLEKKFWASPKKKESFEKKAILLDFSWIFYMGYKFLHGYYIENNRLCGRIVTDGITIYNHWFLKFNVLSNFSFSLFFKNSKTDHIAGRTILTFFFANSLDFHSKDHIYFIIFFCQFW